MSLASKALHLSFCSFYKSIRRTTYLEWKHDKFIKAYAAKKKFEATIPIVLSFANMTPPMAMTKTKMYPRQGSLLALKPFSNQYTPG